MTTPAKKLGWIGEGIACPPFSEAGKREAGGLLRQLQNGHLPEMPHSRPTPSIGPRCHELRVRDEGHHWRIIYRMDEDAILIVHVFAKKSGKTPDHVIDLCQKRLRKYDEAAKQKPAEDS